MKIAGCYGVFVGVLMLAQWIFFLATGQVPEIQTEPYRISLHLAAELITAAGLIISGVALLKNTSWSRKAFLFFDGMLVYSVIASPGYFAQLGQWVLVGMFALLLLLAIVCALLVAGKIKS